jgi:AcrR family transcriptional regulator
VTAPARRSRLEHEERRASILDAARRLLCTRPFSEVSMTELAREAGVARGLLHHYFGSKRDLYLEVVRSLVRLPALPASTDEVWEVSVDRWLDLVEANAELWLTIIGTGATGRDADVEAILDDAEERTAERALAAVGVEPAAMTSEVRAVARGFGGLAEAVTREWLGRGRLTRGQARAVLVEALPFLVAAIRRAPGAT